MSKKLKTLAENNGEAFSRNHAMSINEPELNGIACPKCGEELYDSNPNTILTSNPPQKNVHCSKCDHIGYRYC